MPFLLNQSIQEQLLCETASRQWKG